MSIRIKDPIYVDMKIPKQIEPLLLTYPVNRMRFITQLGLKAYSGSFASANHTRFMHSLGTMHLADKLCSKLYDNTDDRNLRASVKEYKPVILVSALLHDVGHGPFSHVMDSVLRDHVKMSHEEMTTSIIETILKKDIERLDLDSTVNSKEVCDIILGKHTEHYYLNDIVAGELDVDRMDYLARDAYHSGIEYRFGADSLISAMKIVKKHYEEDLIETVEKNVRDVFPTAESHESIERVVERIRGLGDEHVCIKGESGVVHAEMLLITRRTMYENVYYEEKSQIAEKMVSRAISWMIEQGDFGENELRDPNKYVLLDDFELFSRMKQCGDFSTEIVERVKTGNLYDPIAVGKVADLPLLKEIVARNRFDQIRGLEKELAEKWGADPVRVLVDLVIPEDFKRERVFVEMEGEPRPLEEVSPVARSLVKIEELQGNVSAYIDKQQVHVEDSRAKREVKEVLGGD